MQFSTFHHAYTTLVRRVYEHPTYQNAPRGFPSREQVGVHFTLRDSTQRVPLVPARRLNIVFNFAEALWYLSGRDDLRYIAYYAPRMRAYSADGIRLTGTAYGRAIFGRNARPDQWRRVVDQLGDDPDSKRAVIQIFRAEELEATDNPDVSCTIGLQFLLREGRLHAIGFMRANDAYRGMASDVFSFTLLQEVLARELGAQPGWYVHSVGSLHVYGADDAAVRALLSDPASRGEPTLRFPAMPDGDNWPYVREVLRYEEALRENRLRLGPELARLGLPGYWAQVVLLFDLYRRLLREETVDDDLLDALAPIYRWLVAQRWRLRSAGWPPGRPAGLR